MSSQFSTIPIKEDVIITLKIMKNYPKKLHTFDFPPVYFTVKRTSNNLDLHVSFEVKSDIPPSYESVMSRSNEAFQATDSLPPSTSASNKDSSEDVDPPLSYPSLIS